MPPQRLQRFLVSGVGFVTARSFIARTFGQISFQEEMAPMGGIRSHSIDYERFSGDIEVKIFGFRSISLGDIGAKITSDTGFSPKSGIFNDELASFAISQAPPFFPNRKPCMIT
jgi:hypothetical protein